MEIETYILTVYDKDGNPLEIPAIRGKDGEKGADGATAEQVIAALPKETWTFTLADGSTVEKEVPLL